MLHRFFELIKRVEVSRVDERIRNLHIKNFADLRVCYNLMESSRDINNYNLIDSVFEGLVISCTILISNVSIYSDGGVTVELCSNKTIKTVGSFSDPSVESALNGNDLKSFYRRLTSEQKEICYDCILATLSTIFSVVDFEET